jgi:single-strand DNA-binding protein
MYSKVFVVGNLGNDPEMRYTPDGTAVTNLSVASNRKYTNRAGELVNEATWYRVSVWGKQAEACNEYLSKGRLVHVEGQLIPDPQTGGPKIFTRNDGTAGAQFEMRAQSVQFLGGGNGNGSATPSSEDTSGKAEAQEEDEIPF